MIWLLGTLENSSSSAKMRLRARLFTQQWRVGCNNFTNIYALSHVCPYLRQTGFVPQRAATKNIVNSAVLGRTDTVFLDVLDDSASRDSDSRFKSGFLILSFLSLFVTPSDCGSAALYKDVPIRFLLH